MADRLACKLALCSCSNASFFVSPPSIPTANRGTHGHTFYASLAQIDAEHHLSKGRLLLQEVLLLPSGSVLGHVSMVLPELPNRPIPGPRIAPTFWAVLLKENKAMVFFWRPESGRHFGSRTVVQGSTFGGLVVSLLVGFWAASRT